MLHPLFLRGEPRETGLALTVTDKMTSEPAFEVALADARTVEEAVAAAHGARHAMAELAAHVRRDALAHVASRLRERTEELAQILAVEGGKPVAAGRIEVGRAVDTFRIASEEATRIGGEVLPLDLSPRSAAYWGAFRRVPVGAAALITPFNFPLNLVAHKVAPAIAAGCPFVLKPASTTPRCALVLGEILAETPLPKDAWSILPTNRAAAEVLATDPRIAALSFTGSSEVGWALRAKAGKKRVGLELGGNAAVVVGPDTDLDDAAERITFGAFFQAGQSCISVQRILAQRTIVDALTARLVERAGALPTGDPRRDETVVGPLISAGDVERLLGWIEQAVAAGATLLTGGTRSGNVLAPTLLSGVPRDQPLACEEAFGPVAVIDAYDDFDDALARVNDSRFGLQAGVFTRDLHEAERAWRVLEVGGVVIGDVPSFRVDNMPYGGVKDSGTGREGVRFAIDELTELRMMVARRR